MIKNKGFTLIEIIIYISLLSIVIMGFFVTVMGMINDNYLSNHINPTDYEKLIKYYHAQ